MFLLLLFITYHPELVANNFLCFFFSFLSHTIRNWLRTTSYVSSSSFYHIPSGIGCEQLLMFLRLLFITYHPELVAHNFLCFFFFFYHIPYGIGYEQLLMFRLLLFIT